MGELAAILVGYVGWTALAATRTPAYRVIWKEVPSRGTVTGLRLVSVLCLSGVGTACILANGWGRGLTVWFGAQTAATLILILVLALAPRVAFAIAVPALLAGILVFIAGGT